MSRPLLALVATLLLSCSRAEPPSRRAEDSVSTALAAHASGALPAMGIAVMDTAGRWCAVFPDSVPVLAPGSRTTIVLVEQAKASSWDATVQRVRETTCPTAFGQPRWDSYRAYNLALVDSLQLDAGDVPLATLAVASAGTWSRGTDGVARADLDGDGEPEEARVCRADEGLHITVWSGSGATRRRRAHEYFDLGALVDPTCTAGESAVGDETGPG